MSNEFLSREELVQRGFLAEHINTLLGPSESQNGIHGWPAEHVEDLIRNEIAPAVEIAYKIDAAKLFARPGDTHALIAGAAYRAQRAPFAMLLEALIQRGFPSDSTPVTSAEISRRCDEVGYPVSRPYIGQLRSGLATNPALAAIKGLSFVFGVSPGYFFQGKPAAGPRLETEN